MTFDLTPIAVKNAAGTSVPMIAYDDGTNQAFAHASVNAAGAIINPATSDNQTTGNSALATMVAQTADVATGAKQDTGNASAVTIASNTGALSTNLGVKADTAATTDTGTFSLIALFKRLLSTSTTMSTAQGAPADAAVTNPASSASIIAALKGILTGVNAATPAGTNLMGKVGFDQTTPGTTNGVQVNAALPAGTNLIGSVTAPGTVHLTAAPTVTAGAYAAGTVVGGLITLTGAARVNSGSGLIQSVIVTVKTALTQPFDILFFDTNPTNSTFTDNSALAVNVADLPYLCGIAHCTDLVSLGTPQGLAALNVAIPFKLSAAATSLYAVIVMRGSGQTLASTSAIGLSALILQD